MDTGYKSFKNNHRLMTKWHLLEFLSSVSFCSFIYFSPIHCLISSIHGLLSSPKYSLPSTVSSNIISVSCLMPRAQSTVVSTVKLSHFSSLSVFNSHSIDSLVPCSLHNAQVRFSSTTFQTPLFGSCRIFLERHSGW